MSDDLISVFLKEETVTGVGLLMQVWDRWFFCFLETRMPRDIHIHISTSIYLVSAFPIPDSAGGHKGRRPSPPTHFLFRNRRSFSGGRTPKKEKGRSVRSRSQFCTEKESKKGWVLVFIRFSVPTLFLVARSPVPTTTKNLVIWKNFETNLWLCNFLQ